MAKQEIRTKQTQLNAPGANGHQVEQTYTVDDSFLPSPLELQQYKEIHPEIVQLLIDASRNEQNHRHFIDKQKMKAINRESKSVHWINVLGMTLAFLIMFGGLLLSAYLISIDKETLGSIFGGATILIAAGTFLNHVKKEKK